MTERGMANQERTAPPYAPYRSWKNLLEKLKRERPLPRQLDSSFWTRLKFSGALIGVLKPTMVKLGLLTTDMEPTSMLDELLDASGPREPIVYSRLMDQAYPDYYDHLELDRMTDGELTQYFVSIGASGETGQKARTFFLGLAKDAEKTLSNRVSTRTRRATSPARQVTPRQRRPQTESREPSLSRGHPTSTILHEDAAPAQNSLMLWGLFRRLPRPGSVFAPRDRETWLEAAKTMFDLEYGYGEEQAGERKAEGE
jgi:hypothetical protein